MESREVSGKRKAAAPPPSPPPTTKQSKHTHPTYEGLKQRVAETGASLSLEDTLQAIKDLPSTSPSYQSLVLYAADGILDLEPCVEELLEYADKRRHAVCVKLEEMGMPKPDQLAFNTVFKNYVDRVIMSHLVERLDNPGRLKCVVKTLEQARQQAIQRLHKVEQRRLPRGTNSMAIAGRSEAEDSIMGDEGRARDGRDIPEFSGILHVVQSKRADHPASSKHGDTGERRLVGTHEEAVAPVYEAETIQLQKQGTAAPTQASIKSPASEVTQPPEMLTLQRAATQAGWSNAKIIESFTSYENLLRVQEINQKAKNACYHLFTTAGVPAIRQKPNNSQLIVDTIMTFLNKRKEHLGRPFATHDWIQTPKGPKNIRQLKSEKNFRKQLLHAWHEEGKEEVDLDQKLSDFVRCNKDFFPELWGCRCGGALEVNPG